MRFSSQALYSAITEVRCASGMSGASAGEVRRAGEGEVDDAHSDEINGADSVHSRAI